MHNTLLQGAKWVVTRSGKVLTAKWTVKISCSDIGEVRKVYPKAVLAVRDCPTIVFHASSSDSTVDGHQRTNIHKWYHIGGSHHYAEWVHCVITLDHHDEVALRVFWCIFISFFCMTTIFLDFTGPYISSRSSILSLRVVCIARYFF